MADRTISLTKIEGFVRALTPIHQTRPVEAFFDPGAPNKVSFQDRRKGRVQSMMTSTFWGQDQRRRELPSLSGNGLRGAYRRSGTGILCRAMGQPMRTELFQCLAAGAAGKDAIGGGQTALLLSKAREHVFAGLFGGGFSMLPSLYTVQDLTPIYEPIRHLIPAWVCDAAGVVGVDAASNSDQRDASLCHVYTTIRRDPMLDGEGVSFVHEHDVEFMKYQEEVGLARKAKEAKKAGETVENEGEAGLRMMSYVEAIIPGVPLSFGMKMKPHVNNAQLGLMLMTLLEWVRAQSIGGASRRGFGTFEQHLKLFHPDFNGPVEIIQSEVIDGAVVGYTLNDRLIGFTDEAQVALSNCSVVELEKLFLAGYDKKKEADKIKKAKKAKSAVEPSADDSSGE